MFFRPDNLYKPEDLTTFEASGDILMDVCPAKKPRKLEMDGSNKKVRSHSCTTELQVQGIFGRGLNYCNPKVNEINNCFYILHIFVPLYL